VREWLEEQYEAEYQVGREACLSGMSEDDNPHEPSGHPRDSTHADELHFHWWRGYCNAQED
jgi:hypothetical protein